MSTPTRHEAAARIGGAVAAVVDGRIGDIAPLLDDIEALPLGDTLSAWQWLAETVVGWAAEARVQLAIEPILTRLEIPGRLRPTLHLLVSEVDGATRSVVDLDSGADDDDDPRRLGVGELIGGAVLVLRGFVAQVGHATGIPQARLVAALPAYGEPAPRLPRPTA